MDSLYQQSTLFYDVFSKEINEKAVYLMEWANPGSSKYTLTKNWFLADPTHAVLIAASYLLFVFFGSAVMKCKSSPINVSFFKYMYNPVQVVLCAFMMIEAARQAIATGERTIIGMTFNPEREQIASILWWFYLSKVLDFADTAFIILGQKWRQLSFLHVYHHTSIFLVYWLNLRCGYDGDIYLTIILNCFVHTVMYLYYMITSLNLYVPVDQKAAAKAGKGKLLECKPYVPSWKSAVTMTQMVQFIIMNVQAVMILYNDYGYPKNVTWFYLFYIQSLFWLFFNFFVQSYCKKGDKKKKKSA